jgi:hypothetical protein
MDILSVKSWKITLIPPPIVAMDVLRLFTEPIIVDNTPVNPPNNDVKEDVVLAECCWNIFDMQ